MHWVKTTVKMILVAVTTIFWVSVMNKLYYGCLILVCNNPVFFSKLLKLKCIHHYFFLKFLMKNHGVSYGLGNTVSIFVIVVRYLQIKINLIPFFPLWRLVCGRVNFCAFVRTVNKGAAATGNPIEDSGSESYWLVVAVHGAAHAEADDAVRHAAVCLWCKWCIYLAQGQVGPFQWEHSLEIWNQKNCVLQRFLNDHITQTYS